MSDTPTDSNAGTIEGADESLAASVRAALVEWADHVVPALGADFTDAVMSDALAHERAIAWQAAFVPPLPDDFAERVAREASASVAALTAMSAWEASCVPELPSDFADVVLEAASQREASEEASRRVAMGEWQAAYVPALPASFAQSITDEAMRGLDDAPRTSGVVEKVVPIAPRRRWMAPAAVSSFAAAAVAILALSRGPKPQSPHAQTTAGHSDGPPRGEPRVTPNTHNQTTAQNPAINAPATAPDEGSEVEKVEVDGDRASFTAFSLAGEDEHSTVAVVWIEDGTKGSSTQ